jgi:hypothetical protein
VEVTDREVVMIKWTVEELEEFRGYVKEYTERKSDGWDYYPLICTYTKSPVYDDVPHNEVVHLIFFEPFEVMPLLINSSSTLERLVSQWRLKKGR